MKIGKLHGKVDEIRNRYGLGESITSIAKSFNVKYPSIYFKIFPEKQAKARIGVSKAIFEARIKAINLLGGRCSHCGFSDLRVLQIDHINGLQNEKRTTNYKLYLEIVNNPEIRKKHQVLCANCNWIKRYENKETRNGVRYNIYEQG